MLKDLNFTHMKLISDAKKWVIWEICISTQIPSMPMHMIVSLTRPPVDEDQIKKNVTYRYQEKLKDSLFSEAVREQIEEEIKSELYHAKEAYKKMPRPTIFHARLSEYKDNFDKTIKLKVEKQCWLYIYKNSHDMDKMLISVDQYPDYIRGDQEVDKIVEEFKEKNEDFLDITTIA